MLVVLAPLAPAPTGNGLAMRLHALVDAALEDHDVHLVEVPVQGLGVVDEALAARLASHQVLVPARRSRRPLVRLRSDAAWRSRSGGIGPLPIAAALAPPRLAAEIRLGERPPRTVLACRLVLAPLGLALAEQLDVPLVLDSDDDDEALLRSLGELQAAEVHHRLASVHLPAARLVLAAGAPDADALSCRHHLDPPVVVVPNAAPLPRTAPGPPPGDGRVLMVGNLAYEPNVDGARWFVREVLPRLPAHLHVHLVGPHDARVADLAGPRVVVHGRVPHVDEHYRAADVAVAPLHHGAGTRTKVLEALAHRRAVVSTAAGVAGLEVVADQHVRVADDPEAFAAAVVAASEAAASGRPDPLVDAAEVLATTTYHPDTVRGHTAALLRSFGGSAPEAASAAHRPAEPSAASPPTAPSAKPRGA